MSLLCSPEKCTSCFVCESVCKHHAIRHVLDKKGFFVPEIDESKCIECGLCSLKCPVLHAPVRDNKEQPRTLAAFHSNKPIRMQSSSGGAFSALAESVLNDGGIVFGAAWTNKLTVEHIAVSNVADLELLRRSKYLPSNLKNSYAEVKQFLKKEIKVLFSGTPCQIAGLYKYLGNMDIQNLITVDFVCHGVPSQKVFDKYINYLETKYKHKIVEVNFRDKKYGVECNLLLRVCFDNGQWRNFIFEDNSFYRGFISNLYLKDACYHCTFNTLPRIADFTLADYRGLGNKKQFKLEKDRPLGFTGLLLNNAKADNFIKTTKLQYEERCYEEFASGQPHLLKPASKPTDSYSFFMDLDSMSYKDLSRKYMNMTKNRYVDIILRMILRSANYYALGCLYKRIKGIRSV